MRQPPRGLVQALAILFLSAATAAAQPGGNTEGPGEHPSLAEAAAVTVDTAGNLTCTNVQTCLEEEADRKIEDLTSDCGIGQILQADGSGNVGCASAGGSDADTLDGIDSAGFCQTGGAGCPAGQGGDDVKVNGVEAVNPDFRNQGDITFVRCSGAIAKLPAPIGFANGGTGNTSFNDGRVLLGGATNLLEMALMAKGEIIAGDGMTAPLNLAAPTTGQVLVGDTGEATGLKWEDGVTLRAGEIAGIAAKTEPIGADLFIIEDSAASDAKKSVRMDDIDHDLLQNYVAKQHRAFSICSIVIESATTDDDIFCGRSIGAATLIALQCVATGGTTPSAQIVHVVECSSTGSSCVSSGLELTIGALLTPGVDIIPTDAAIDNDDWWGLSTISVTTPADYLHCQIGYSQP